MWTYTLSGVGLLGEFLITPTWPQRTSHSNHCPQETEHATQEKHGIWDAILFCHLTNVAPQMYQPVMSLIT